ncbi:hypothetical protein BOTCAL_0117g00090 [Botryotinia calthae]|uniref:Ketoreductase (KR) domain-containing protein n=1 Tax=Botryotinia calthae TaxID=38488 RepID=A0A4Y8D5B7_9HELO|nr:hypothetical protein BOTCAL_0117g00090 [Botryotinia calthae]
MSTTMNLKEAVVVITGASRGIGVSIAHAFSKAGSSLCLIARSTMESEDLAQELIHEYKIGVGTWTANISDITRVTGVAHEIKARYGRVDVIINNAGITQNFVVQPGNVDTNILVAPGAVNFDTASRDPELARRVQALKDTSTSDPQVTADLCLTLATIPEARILSGLYIDAEKSLNDIVDDISVSVRKGSNEAKSRAYGSPAAGEEKYVDAYECHEGFLGRDVVAVGEGGADATDYHLAGEHSESAEYEETTPAPYFDEIEAGERGEDIDG